MLTFIKRFLKAIYNNTVGAVVRCIRNTLRADVDKEDRITVGRVVTYFAFITFAVFFPEIAALLAVLRMLVVLDVIGTIASVFQDTANAYA